MIGNERSKASMRVLEQFIQQEFPKSVPEFPTLYRAFRRFGA